MNLLIHLINLPTEVYMRVLFITNKFTNSFDFELRLADLFWGFFLFKSVHNWYIIIIRLIDIPTKNLEWTQEIHPRVYCRYLDYFDLVSLFFKMCFIYLPVHWYAPLAMESRTGSQSPHRCIYRHFYDTRLLCSCWDQKSDHHIVKQEASICWN